MVNKWIQAIMWLLLASISIIEAYEAYRVGGVENWKLYAFGLLAIVSFYFYFRKKKERDAIRLKERDAIQKEKK